MCGVLAALNRNEPDTGNGIETLGHPPFPKLTDAFIGMSQIPETGLRLGGDVLADMLADGIGMSQIPETGLRPLEKVVRADGALIR